MEEYFRDMGNRFSIVFSQESHLEKRSAVTDLQRGFKQHMKRNRQEQKGTSCKEAAYEKRYWEYVNSTMPQKFSSFAEFDSANISRNLFEIVMVGQVDPNGEKRVVKMWDALLSYTNENCLFAEPSLVMVLSRASVCSASVL